MCRFLNVLYSIARNLVFADVKEEPKTTVVFINTQSIIEEIAIYIISIPFHIICMYMFVDDFDFTDHRRESLLFMLNKSCLIQVFITTFNRLSFGHAEV